jgi:hypothetical protein
MEIFMHVGLVIAREQTQSALQNVRTSGPAELKNSALVRRIEDGTVTPKDARAVDGFDKSNVHVKALSEAVHFQIEMQGPVRTSLEKARDWLSGL